MVLIFFLQGVHLLILRPRQRVAQGGGNVVKYAKYALAANSKLVISFSLYGDSSRYCGGALTNALLYQWVYPGWEMWVYHDNSVPENVLIALLECEVKLIDMTDSVLNPRSWRFLPASENAVDRMCSRDIDSILSLRDFAAVSKWLETENKFLALRDHPGHHSYPINAGMWCAANDAIPQMSSLLQNYSKEAHFVADQQFLEKMVWPIVANNTLQIVSQRCGSYPNSYSFPVPRVGLEHIGAVYISGLPRERDDETLRVSIAEGRECPCCFKALPM